MKTMLCLVLVAITSLAQAQKPAPAGTDFKNLSWLEGHWTRTNAKPGRSGTETWTRISDVEWKGLGVTLRGVDTAVVEKLKILVRNGTIFYVADVTENKEPVSFAFTELSSTHFVCESPAHDFPKKIAYRREGRKLKAVISGDGKEIEYWFERSE